MMHSYLLLTPLIILLVIALAGFVGCEFAPGMVTPSPPTGLFAVVQNDKIVLSWDANPNPIAYNIKRGTDPGVYAVIDTISGPANSYEDTSAAEDTRYNYVVSTFSGSQESSDSGEVYATIPTEFIVTKAPSVEGNAITGYAGMGFLYNGPPIVVTTLGRFRAAGNNEFHLLKILERNNPAIAPVELQSVTVDVKTAAEGSFAYAELLKEVILQPGNVYYVVSQEMPSPHDSYIITGNVTSKFPGLDVYPVIQDGTGPFVAGTGSIGNMYGPVDFKYISDIV